jgi:hypothetical protein
VPAAVAPELASGDAFMLVAAFLVDPLHRRVHRVPLDSMQPELTKGKTSPDVDRFRGVASAPGRTLADHQPPRRPSMAPVDPVQTDKPNVPLGLVNDRPAEIGVAFRFHLFEEQFFLTAGDTEIQLNRGGDLRIVEPDVRLRRVCLCFLFSATGSAPKSGRDSQP